ncbi:hypothetical protein ACLBXM_00855 [Xanthobacteraceae bacterium A53D]
MRTIRISVCLGAMVAMVEPGISLAGPTCTPDGVCSNTIYSSTPLAVTYEAVTMTNSGAIEVGSSPTLYGLSVTAQGANGDTSLSIRGGNAGAATTTNSGAISLTGNGQQAGAASGLLVQAVGGTGLTSADAGGNGGNATAGVTVQNSAQISLDGTFIGGAAGIRAQSLGGNGSDGDNGSGGGGGWGGTVQLRNDAAVSLGTSSRAASGAGSAYGLLALSQGGSGGHGQPAMGTGGPGGYAGLVSSQAVSVYWNWTGTPPVAGDQVFGVLAKSAGGNAPSGVTNAGTSAPYGGNTGQASATVSGDVTVVAGNAPASAQPGVLPAFNGAGVGAVAVGGKGGITGGTVSTLGTNPYVRSGDGGDAGDPDYSPAGMQAAGAQVSVTGATVRVVGDGIAGVLSMTQGGDGSSGNFMPDQTNGTQGGNGGNGGNGGRAFDAAAVVSSTVLSTSGTGATGLAVLSLGGAGGEGSTLISGLSGGDAGDGGAGGAAGSVTVALSGGAISTTGQNSVGVLALSADGNGGNGGYRSGGSGDAGGGGNAGCQNGNACSSDLKVAVTVSGTSITTAGDNSAGVVAASIGGKGGDGGTDDVNTSGSPRNGGNGGNSGLAIVAIEQGTTITTGGDKSAAVVAVSIAGQGGVGTSQSNIGSSNAGNGGDGGLSGLQTGSAIFGHAVLLGAEVENEGMLITSGENSFGILARSVAGGGGAGGTAGGIVGTAGAGGNAGTAGAVGVLNGAYGRISTAGLAAHGILAQSIGGNGGNGGDLDFANTGNGGNAGSAANGNKVAVINAGLIQTAGQQAAGILAQSIGGGGGDGGSGTNMATIGGTAGSGGDGDTVKVTAGGIIVTKGDLASGIVAQSVGGGGGAGGNATGFSPVFSLAIGGAGGGGGDGATTTLEARGLTVQTGGGNAHGLVAQSVGGGGGTGGSGFAYSVSTLIGGAVAVGGDGGDGGNGGAVAVNLGRTSIITGATVQSAADPALAPDNTYLTPLAVDAFGILAQSIGGGGGAGGSSVAKAYVQDMKIPGTTSAAAFSFTYAAGGTGGGGGDGGAVTLNLAEQVGVLTYGNGSHGLFAQSIGGGGGTGGDSSAVSTTFGYKNLSKVIGQANYNVDIALAVGGDGGAGGTGGAVNLTLAGTNGQANTAAANAPVSLTTLGDFAHGVLAQSVGGGGGNAGAGSGSTQNGTSSSTAFKIAMAVGGTGSAGGDGGAVTVSAFAGTNVATYGDGAHGIVAQSVGGGGGNSGTGSFQLGLPSMNEISKLIDGAGSSWVGNFTSSFTLKVGNTGAAGGQGGNVNLSLAGTRVATSAQGANAIVAQSIGGGGGIGGSAGSSGSSDNPNVIVDSAGKPYNPNLIDNPSNPTDPSTPVDPSDDPVDLDDLKADKKFVNGVAAYMIDIAKKIEAGGTWGSAMRDSLSSFLPSLNFALSLGGSGGTGGDGGVVNGTLSQVAISTLGDYSNGAVFQSIGGGGGIGGGAVAGGAAGFGSIMKLNANLALGATGGDGGNGGAVTISLGDGQISTRGYAANGLFVQSIGGGGGLVGSAQTNSSGYFSLGASSSVSGSAGGNGGAITLTTPASQGATLIATSGDAAMGVLLQSIGGGGGTAADGFTLTPGILSFSGDIDLSAGGKGIAGSGGAVTFNATNMPYLSIATSGDSAFGILAQSVGGGGGIAFRQPGSSGTFKVGGSGTAAVNSGGEVSITLRDGSSIATSGNGSHAIFAQSVGGGGGIAGLAAGSTQLYDATPSDGPGAVTSGYGGTISIATGKSTISTTGASAYGIFAQSVGAGGGVKSCNAGNCVIAGTTGASGSVGFGGKISVVQDGIISATGANAVGIFAQSVGQGTGIDTGGANITVNSLLQGGSGGQGWGIWIDTGDTANTVTIGAAGSVSALSGQAIRATGEGTTMVYNSGTVQGSYSLPGASQFLNLSGATLVATGGLTGDLTNAGTVIVAAQATGAQRTVALAGDFTQGRDGQLAVRADFGTGAIDHLHVSGNATLDGKLILASANLLPNRTLRFMDVDGTVSGQFASTKQGVFDFEVVRSGGAYTVSAKADFDQGLAALAPNPARAASYLQAAWDAGGGNLGPVFGNLANLSGTAYTTALGNLSSDTLSAPGAETLALSQQNLDRLMSCPVFEGASAIVTQSSCMWAMGAAQLYSQSGFGGATGYDNTIYSYAMGMQKEMLSGWFLGIAGGYDDSRISGDGTTANGSSGWIGLSLKHETGPWLFSAAANATFGAYDMARQVSIGSLTGTAKGTNDLASGGARLRAAYTFGSDAAYLRPFVDLDLIYTSLSGYTESGAGVLDLDVSGSHAWTMLATPAMEIGMRTNLDGGLILRTYAKAGVTLSNTDGWSTAASLRAAPVGIGAFSAVLPMDDVYGRVGAGLDLSGLANGFQLRGEYEGAFSEHSSRNMGSLRLSLPF